MKISQKGLYALQAMMMLARHHQAGPIKIREIAVEEGLPEKFLEIILIELKNARLVESTRGARGGYRLRRAPSDIHLSEVIRVIDGPLAPFGDAEHLRDLISHDASHRALYKVFLAVRNSASRILGSTTLADVASLESPDSRKQARKPKTNGVSAFPSAAPVPGREEIPGLVRARS
jgi:Rrf2 family protein